VEAYIGHLQKVVEDAKRRGIPVSRTDISRFRMGAPEGRTLRMLRRLKEDADGNKDAIALLEGTHVLSGAFKPLITTETRHRTRRRKTLCFKDEQSFKKWQRSCARKGWNSTLNEEGKKKYLRRFGYPKDMTDRKYGGLPKEFRDAFSRDCAIELLSLMNYYE
jgi:hypothetical protein